MHTHSCFVLQVRSRYCDIACMCAWLLFMCALASLYPLDILFVCTEYVDALNRRPLRLSPYRDRHICTFMYRLLCAIDELFVGIVRLYKKITIVQIKKNYKQNVIPECIFICVYMSIYLLNVFIYLCIYVCIYCICMHAL